MILERFKVLQWFAECTSELGLPPPTPMR